MRLIIQQYLGSLKERGELDAILPDLLTEIGFEVLTRPMRGTSQAGVDIAAVGPDPDDNDVTKLFLFTLKAGDLGRRDWNGGTDQAVRPSLDEIQDSYISHRIPEQYKSLPIAICVCMGGTWSENVRDNWAGYVENHTKESLCFREWNGARLTDLLLKGVLRQELLNTERRSDFQKAIAMADQPDVSYRFFDCLVRGLLLEPHASPKQGLSHLRQAYICLWILYVWARDTENLESPYKCSELALLLAWHVVKSGFGKTDATSAQATQVVDQLINLHLLIAHDFLTQKIEPFVSKPYVISRAVNSQSSVDVNLAVSDVFGRIVLNGLWQHWLASFAEDKTERGSHESACNAALSNAIVLINNNPTLKSPICDDFAIEISLFMLLAQACERLPDVVGFIVEITHRCCFALRSRGRYPVPTRDYHELAEHPRDNSDEYFREMTGGSILYPVLRFWADFCSLDETREQLVRGFKRELSHTTHQLWVPDTDTEDTLWIGETYNGRGLTLLPVDKDTDTFMSLLEKICNDYRAFNELSAMKFGLWPFLLLACRHYRMPVPPQFWAPFIESGTDEGTISEEVVD